eukprot:TRINITY_DN22789_c0_g5_i1.p1 TRINITY_DN22789_c0_g5~~TRINITY_DN22789_c0_g5_i1.p1  ORF type:complete len:427 (-),score=38.02 TRINITY_DN22789_c0_g5_i1:265-1545(-)
MAEGQELLATLDSFAFPGSTETPPHAASASPAEECGSSKEPGSAEKTTSSSTKKRKLRQAAETEKSDGQVQVEVLCTQCRRDSQSKRQMSLGAFLAPRVATGDTNLVVLDLTEAPQEADHTLCNRCRRPLVVQHMSVGKTSTAKKRSVGCCFSARLKQYKRQAVETHAEWRLTDSEAMALMRDSCVLCGMRADPQAGKPNGITRLRAVAEVRGMGPYAPGNVATACSTCNLLKGIHTVEATRLICRSIATHRNLGEFGTFPECFPNNISRKSRSCYLGDTARKSKGTIASKTHNLTNAEFNSIVSGPCHFCGKESDPPRHYNGLDRLDNSLRVYTKDNSVSCCGTCNMAKGKSSEEFFLEQCRTIAARAVNTCSGGIASESEMVKEREGAGHPHDDAEAGADEEFASCDADAVADCIDLDKLGFAG